MDEKQGLESQIEKFLQEHPNASYSFLKNSIPEADETILNQIYNEFKTIKNETTEKIQTQERIKEEKERKKLEKRWKLKKVAIIVVPTIVVVSLLLVLLGPLGLIYFLSASGPIILLVIVYFLCCRVKDRKIE